MPADHTPAPSPPGGVLCVLDAPRAGEKAFAEALSLEGWLYLPTRSGTQVHLRVWQGEKVIGETRRLFVRPDVSRALRVPEQTRTGFRILARAHGCGPARLRLTARWPDEEAEQEVASVEVELLSAQLERRPYGDVVHPEETRVLPRRKIYGWGPPVDEPGSETLQLIERHLTPGSSVLDVGCGSGAYGPALIAAGHSWLGLETHPDCCRRLESRGLPFRRVRWRRLPCAKEEFDEAICVEVLEHIARPEIFLREIARCIRGRALFSVPNMEVIPYFSAWQVVPWHLLEADHKNFFTRSSLRELLQRHFAEVEVTSYAPHPLRTPEGVALHLHLFAVAETARQ